MEYAQQKLRSNNLVTRIKRYFLFASLLLTCILCATPVMARDLHYYAGSASKTETQRREMENTLQTKIPGVYDMYKQLDSSDKQAVLDEFLKHKKFSAASKIIIRLYSGE